MPRSILIALTSHRALGDTGRDTGFFVGEAAHPWKVFTDAGYTVDPAAYDAVFLAGGHGTMWDFPDDPHLAAIARSIYEAGGVVSAVCHGPSGLVNLTLSDGTHLVEGK